MRRIVPVALLMAGACRGPELFLVPQVEIAAEDRGVVLSDDGEFGHVAMRDTTCSFDAEEGIILGDVNLPGDQDRVLDGWRGEVLAASDSGLHRVDRTSELGFVEGAPVQARLTRAGIVGLDNGQGCALRWYEQGEAVALDGSACEGPLAVSRDGERAWVAVQGQLVALEPGRQDTQVVLGAVDGPIAFDERYSVLAAADGQMVSAYSAGGELLWELDAGDPVDAFFRFTDGIGVRVGEDWLAVDPYSGEERARLHDGPRGEVGSSADGTTITISLFGLIVIYETHVGSVRPPRKEPRRLFD